MSALVEDAAEAIASMQVEAAGTQQFHDRIHSRHLDPAGYRLDPGVVEDGIKQAGELAVAIPDQERARCWFRGEAVQKR